MPTMNSKLLSRYSKLVMISVFFLIFVGSLVTSTGSGLAVPDWPLSYGMLFPPMVGGVFYEHGHRLVAAVVGLMTVGLLGLILRYESRTSVKKLGVLAVAMVICQGVLGGITVLLMLPVATSAGHAILGQTFWMVTIAIVYATTNQVEIVAQSSIASVRLLAVATYGQLVVGAIMRHCGAGLAIPDFPLSGGQWIPTFSPDWVAKIDAMRLVIGLPDVTMGQLMIHALHRLGGIVIFGLALHWAWTSRRDPKIRPWSCLVLGLVTVQILLAAVVIWTQKHPHVTSVHVIVGTSILGVLTWVGLKTSSRFNRFIR